MLFSICKSSFIKSISIVLSLNTFDEIWDNPTIVNDIKDKIISNLEEIFEDKSPNLLYFMTLYNIFKDFIGELNEEEIIKTEAKPQESFIS